MKINEIVDITTLKKFCNYKSSKNWYAFTKDGSPLPQLVYATRKNASGSLQVVELYPKDFKENNGFAEPIYYGDITHLIFSYDSLIGICTTRDTICIVNSKYVKTTPTTTKILIELNKKFGSMGFNFYRTVVEAFKLYTSTRLYFKECE